MQEIRRLGLLSEVMDQESYRAYEQSMAAIGRVFANPAKESVTMEAAGVLAKRGKDMTYEEISYLSELPLEVKKKLRAHVASMENNVHVRVVE